MNKALILGAKSDIAKAVAVDLALKGVDLVLAARNVNVLAGFKNELKALKSIAVDLVEFDALAYATHSGFCDKLPNDIDAVFCVFGYLGSQQKAEQDKNERELIFNTNCTGAISILGLITEKGKIKTGGIVVGVSSVAAERIRPSNFYYGSAKAAFNAYLLGLRLRLLPQKIKVLIVKPGYVKTAMTAHLNLPQFITSTPQVVARHIVLAANNGREELYTPYYWRYIIWLVKLIPGFLFSRM